MSSYDIVQFGATGFTGRLVAEHLAGRLPEGASWVIAGRSEERLREVATHVAECAPAGVQPTVEVAELSDTARLDELLSSAKVVLTTVGPYAQHGEPLVAAAARHGLAYVDLSGEPAFADEMYVRYDAQARETGARIIHACGFDSLPHDFGVFLAVSALPSDAPIRATGAVSADAEFSGGTIESALGAFAAPRNMARAAKARHRAEVAAGVGTDRKARAPLGRIRRAPGGWRVPFPGIDAQVVVRSAQQLPAYGPDFAYEHQIALRRFSAVAGLTAGVGALVLAAQIPPLRRKIASLRPAGTGPSEERRARSSFVGRYRATSGSHTSEVVIRGGDPGYTETSKMIGEAAIALAFDDLPAVVGETTPVAALGFGFVDRLVDVGLSVERDGQPVSLVAS